MAQQLVLAERVDKGLITQAEADLQMKQALAGIGTESRQRSALAAASRARDPVTCTQFGYTTTCY